MGRASPEHVGDAWLWAEFWTRYFTDRDRTCSWVVERGRGGPLVGYLTGTPDARRVARYVPCLLPGIAVRVVRARLLGSAASRRALLSLLRSLAGGELSVSRGLVREYPATLHVNLLPEARGRGCATGLLRCFLDRLRAAGVAGVHAQTLSVNEPVGRFCRRAGFRIAARRALHAFAHVEARPIEVCTWVMAL